MPWKNKKTRGEPINDSSITGIKTGLMGPLAGMGDSIIWAAVMPLLIAIFIPFAANGSAMGGIIPLILYPAITLAISYGMVHKGYTLGRDSIIGLLQGGANQRTDLRGQRAGFDHDGRAFRQLRQNHHAVKN